MTSLDSYKANHKELMRPTFVGMLSFSPTNLKITGPTFHSSNNTSQENDARLSEIGRQFLRRRKIRDKETCGRVVEGLERNYSTKLVGIFQVQSCASQNRLSTSHSRND